MTHHPNQLTNAARRLISALTITAGIALCQPKDVDGWQNIKWGMTVSEAKSALGDQWTVDPAQPKVLALKSVKFADFAAEVLIQLRPVSDAISGLRFRLVYVEDNGHFKLRRIDDPPGVETFVAADTVTNTSTFLLLKTFLTQQYGRPNNDTRNKSNGRGYIVSTAVWSFPSTSITLLLNETEGGRVGMVTVEYAEKKQN